jgi:nitrite reductase/ring-hydroxylating ferredoxin subunit
MAQFIKVATTDELGNQQAKLVELEGQKIAVFRVDGAFYALSDTCTHRGGPLSEGTVEGVEVTCPWHGAKFDIRTGAVLGPPAQQGLRSYPVRVTGTDIEIEV